MRETMRGIQKGTPVWFQLRRGGAKRKGLVVETYEDKGLVHVSVDGYGTYFAPVTKDARREWKMKANRLASTFDAVPRITVRRA